MEINELFNEFLSNELVQMENNRNPSCGIWEEEWYDGVIEKLESTSDWNILKDYLVKHKKEFLSLPYIAEIHWLADLPDPNIGVCGGYSLRCIADSWDLFDDLDWQPPATKQPYERKGLLIDIDNWHGTGIFTLVFETDSTLETWFFDGHFWHKMNIQPLEYQKIAIEVFGWPGWQFLFMDEASEYNYQTLYIDPMIKYLSQWVPDYPPYQLFSSLEDSFYNEKRSILLEHFPTINKKHLAK